MRLTAASLMMMIWIATVGSVAVAQHTPNPAAEPSPSELPPSEAPQRFPVPQGAPPAPVEAPAGVAPPAEPGTSDAAAPTSASEPARDHAVARTPHSRESETTHPAPRAADAERAPVAEPAPHTYSYAHAVGIADAWAGGLVLGGAVFTLICIGASVGSEESGSPSTCTVTLVALTAGVGVFMLVPPIIHLAHDRPLAALASFGLRAALPVALTYVGVKADIPSGTITLALLANIATAVLVDQLVLTQVTADPSSPRAGIVPTLTPDAHGAGVAFVARL